MKLKTGKAYARGGLADHGAETILILLRKRGHQIPEPDPGPMGGRPVMARVNHGRWIGDCRLINPATGQECLNAQLVDPDDPRFFCVECYNAQHGGRWRRVDFPADLGAVEGPLEGLPEFEQNWEPPFQREA